MQKQCILPEKYTKNTPATQRPASPIFSIFNYHRVTVRRTPDK